MPTPEAQCHGMTCLDRRESPGSHPFEVQLPEIHWQPTFKASRCFLPSAWPPSFPGSWADLATLCPAVCELWQPVQVWDREVVEKSGGGRGSGGGRRVASPVAPGPRGHWVSLEPTLSTSVKRRRFQGEHNPTPLQSNLWETREISNTLSFRSSVHLKCTLVKMAQLLQKTVQSLPRDVGDKTKVKNKKMQSFTNFNFPAEWVYASCKLLELFAKFAVATLLFPWQPRAATTYLFLRLCNRCLEKTGSFNINIPNVLLCLSSGAICLSRELWVLSAAGAKGMQNSSASDNKLSKEV